MNILQSNGWKRLIASVLSAINSVVATLPHGVALTPILSALAAALGVTGLTHAAVASNLKGLTSANIASVIAVLLLVAQNVPQLSPWIPLLQMLASFFGGAALTKGVSQYIKTQAKAAVIP